MENRVIVIGSGVGGSASAALLAKAGYETTLIESHDFPGGRCASLERDDVIYDFGVHMFSRAERGPLGEVNRHVGGNLSWIKKDPPCHVMGRVEFDFPLDIRPLFTQISLARKLGVKMRNYAGAFLLFRRLMGGRGVEDADPVVLRDFISNYTDDEMIHLFVNCLSQLYFALSYEESSAGEFLWCFTRMFNEANFGYPRGGGGEICRSYIEGLERLGGSIHFGEPVKAIMVENGRARGVRTASGEYPADLVVSNAGLRNTIQLAGSENFPPEYVAMAEGYRDSNAYTTIKYALDHAVIPYPVVFCMPHLPADEVFRYIERETAPEDPYIFLPVPTNWDPSLAPQGQQLVIAGTAAPAHASAELCDAILDRVHTRVCELFPGFEDALLWQSRSTSVDAKELTMHRAGECIGLAQVPSQIGSLRPSLRTPVEGLWLVGADAGSRGIGTEMAAGSALTLMESFGSEHTVRMREAQPSET